uniref:Glycosyltransferase n=1 Tax=Oryza brachyantha TaxID=4533 RepID=J3MYL4_ORYBR
STEDLDAHLPEGFSERTSGRGLERREHLGASTGHPPPPGHRRVCDALWVGGTLLWKGSRTADVPMLCCPLYMEQRINKVLMVEEMGVGVEMEGWLQGLVTTAEEVEAKVRLVMESGQGRELGERVKAHSDGAAMVWKDGGSSRAAFTPLLSNLSNA